MTEKDKTIHIVGDGILKPGVRPMKVIVDENGEYWICDKDFDAKTGELKDSCTAHGSIHMSEGG